MSATAVPARGWWVAAGRPTHEPSGRLIAEPAAAYAIVIALENAFCGERRRRTALPWQPFRLRNERFRLPWARAHRASGHLMAGRPTACAPGNGGAHHLRASGGAELPSLGSYSADGTDAGALGALSLSSHQERLIAEPAVPCAVRQGTRARSKASGCAGLRPLDGILRRRPFGGAQPTAQLHSWPSMKLKYAAADFGGCDDQVSVWRDRVGARQAMLCALAWTDASGDFAQGEPPQGALLERDRRFAHRRSGIWRVFERLAKTARGPRSGAPRLR